MKALADDGSIANCDDIRKAENHCERSMYEASEAGIAFALALVREFKHTYRTLVISEVISDYSPKLDRIREAQALIIKGRAERTSVTEHVQEYLEAFREVRDIVAHFEAHRDDLNLKRRKERRQYLFAILGIVIGLLGIVITLVG